MTQASPATDEQQCWSALAYAISVMDDCGDSGVVAETKVKGATKFRVREKHGKDMQLLAVGKNQLSTSGLIL